jgi:hypothetical protein
VVHETRHAFRTPENAGPFQAEDKLQNIGNEKKHPKYLRFSHLQGDSKVNGCVFPLVVIGCQITIE